VEAGPDDHARGTIYPGTWPFTIRAVYRAKNKSFGDETCFFHWKYLDEKGMGGRRGGHLRARARRPVAGGAITHAVDAHVRELSAATLTETEQAFQAGS
jgi:putative ABC transport system permease protein